MGMEKSRWRADLLEVPWKFVILEGNKYHRGGVANVVGVVHRFSLVDRANSQHGRIVGSERRGGQGVWESEVVRIECKVYVLHAAGHVRVVRWVEHGLKRNCHETAGVQHVDMKEEKKKRKRAAKCRRRGLKYIKRLRWGMWHYDAVAKVNLESAGAINALSLRWTRRSVCK